MADVTPSFSTSHPDACSAIEEAEAAALLAPLLGRAEGVALAVSGGPDSLALLHLGARWRAGERPDLPLIVLTVDHGLRPGSAAEAAQMAALAARCGLPAEILTWEREKPDAASQEQARAARYKLLTQAASRHGASHLATAHHRDDQAETVLMRFLRGSGLRGLAGMGSETELDGLRLVRPLLAVPKSRLVATCRAAGLAFVDDPSNADRRFARARLRALWPLLEEAGADSARIATAAARFARADRALARISDRAAADLLKIHSGGAAWMARPAFGALDPELRIRLLEKAVRGVGIDHVFAVSLSDLEKAEAALSARDRVGVNFAGVQIEADAALILARRERRRGSPAALELRPGASGIWDFRFALRLDSAAGGPVLARALGTEGAERLSGRGAAAEVPAGALTTFLSFWRGEDLLAVPHLDMWEGCDPHHIEVTRVVRQPLFAPPKTP